MIHLTPAYGRDYKSKKEVMKDIKANKDFIFNDFQSRWNGKPCSPADFIGKEIQVRYKNLRNVMVLTIPKDS